MSNDSPRNPTPWNQPLPHRLQLLRPGSTRVAYFSELPDQASFRYRCYNMAQALNGFSTTHSGSYFFLSDLYAVEDLSEFADILVLSRVRYDGHVHRLIDQFKRAGKKVFSDIDDLIFSPRYSGLVARSIGHPTEGEVIDSWFAFLSRIGETLRLSDAVIVTTPHLAGLIHNEYSHPVGVVPNFLNDEQITVSKSARAAKTKSPPGCLRLGYFSGSNSHNLDFQIIAPALKSVLVEHPGLRLVLVGDLTVPAELDPVADNIELLPFMDILSLQEAIAAVDVNLVALQTNDFTYCKSELKFFEAAIVDVPTIATATPIYSSVIKNGVNGFLVEGENWLEMLEHIIGMTPTQLVALGVAARASAELSYLPASMPPLIESALNIG